MPDEVNLNKVNLNEVRPSALQWEEMRARTGDNLAASREILKDAGSITRWSRVLLERSRQRWVEREQARQEAAGSTVQSSEPTKNATQIKMDTREKDAAEQSSAALVRVPLYSGNFVLVLRMENQINLLTSPQMLQLLLHVASEAGKTADRVQQSEYEGNRQPVIVDLRSVDYIDSSGLTALAKGRTALAGMGLQLMILLDPGSQPERVYQLSSLAKIIERIGSLDEL